MSIEDQIQALIAQADPLRLLPADEAESMGLPGIVEQINALRAEQAAGDGIYSVPDPIIDDVPPKRGPGRPPKARIEGDDA